MKKNEQDLLKQKVFTKEKIEQKSHCLPWFFGMILVAAISGTAFLWLPKVSSNLQPKNVSQAEVDERISLVRAELTQLKETWEKRPQMIQRASAPLRQLLLYIDLRLKVESGQPFINELGVLKDYLRDDLPADIIQIAHVGRPNLSYLTNSFLESYHQMIENRPHGTQNSLDKNQSLWEKFEYTLKNAFRKFVHVKPSTDNASALPMEIQKIVTHIKMGELHEGLMYATQRKSMQSWTNHAKAYERVSAYIQQLQTQLTQSS